MEMAAADPQSCPSGDRTHRWMNALLCARPLPRNDELLTGFLFLECASEPALFLEFLLRFKTALGNARDQNEGMNLASRCLAILSPLAERFGMFREKSTLDTQCFRILQPAEYDNVMAFIEQYSKDAALLIDRVEVRMRELVAQLGVTANVSGRFKEPYSIYRKMLKKGHHAPMSLHDIFAFRVIVERHEELCFEVLNLLHDRFTPMPERFKDYITIPKGNGYQSIHTCLLDVLPGLPMPIEVQIRTQAMDDCAERGLASHWVYARTKQSPRMTRTEKKLLDHMKALSNDLRAKKNVICLTRDGDILALSLGATVLDFAYALHTQIGNRARGAKVNGIEVELTYRLKDLDQIEVLLGSQECVRPEWADFVASDSSRRKIHAHSRS